MVLTSRESTYAINISFPVIGVVLLVLRVLSRRHLKLQFLIDDWLCLPAWVRSTTEAFSDDIDA